MKIDNRRMTSEDYKMSKLNGDNYHTWCIRSRAVLVQKRCWEAVEPGYGIEMNEAERKKNDEAVTLLFLIVEDTFLDDIGDCIRARDAWNCLKEMHTKFGLLHVLQLMREFFNINMKPNESVQSYLARLMDLHRKLANGGYAFTDREVALVMLLGLPRSYESLILSLEKDEANLTTTIVKPRLLVEEKRIIRNQSPAKVYHEEQALHTKGFATNQKKPAFGKPMKKYAAKRPNEEETNRGRSTKCFSCGQWGHISKNCEEGKYQYPKSAKTAVDLKANIALLANEEKSRKSNLWILDSGATEHMTSDKRKFSDLKKYTSEV
ncbi:Retrovirus-related Pol polyprotein from transposon TNT 1-94, partial [Stegodyphus mimosarum]